MSKKNGHVNVEETREIKLSCACGDSRSIYVYGGALEKLKEIDDVRRAFEKRHEACGDTE